MKTFKQTAANTRDQSSLNILIARPSAFLDDDAKLVGRRLADHAMSRITIYADGSIARGTTFINASIRKTPEGGARILATWSPTTRCHAATERPGLSVDVSRAWGRPGLAELVGRHLADHAMAKSA